VTKIAWVHGAYFPQGISEIAKNKADIFSHPKTKKAIFHHGLYEYITEIEKEKVSFSLDEKTADYFLSKEFFLDERGVRAYQFDPPFKQTHILHNFLAAVAIAREMKMDWDEINSQVPKLQLPKMRFEIVERGGVTFINDAYNASPDSMRAALSNLPEPKEGGKRIAVLGMMAEMGPDSEAIHREVGRYAQKYVDHLLVLGPQALPIYEGFVEVKKPAEHFSEMEMLSQRLKELMNSGDVVLVKASRVVELDKLC
jgi:UDP-N-acetylmuramoyl-tripeptide--D-alanyl-D-alanine ligase